MEPLNEILTQQTRRTFLERGTLGLGAMALGSLLNARNRWMVMEKRRKAAPAPKRPRKADDVVDLAASDDGKPAAADTGVGGEGGAAVSATRCHPPALGSEPTTLSKPLEVTLT